MGKLYSSERYSSRAGVMSRNEGEKEEELFVWMVFLYLKACDSSRVTVVREGMSVCEDGVIKQPSSVMERGYSNEEQIHIQSLARVVSEVSFGKSIHNLISPSLLRMIN